MTTAKVVETPVTVNNNSPIQDYVHPDEHTQPTYEMSPGFKPFTKWNFKHKIAYLAFVNSVYYKYGWTRERAKWSQSCVLIGYLSGQDGSILPARDFPLWSRERKSSLFYYIINPLLTKLDRSRWLEVYWPRSLIFCFFIDLDFFLAINMQQWTWPIFNHFGLEFGFTQSSKFLISE